jgi:hypothetical protein
MCLRNLPDLTLCPLPPPVKIRSPVCLLQITLMVFGMPGEPAAGEDSRFGCVRSSALMVFVHARRTLPPVVATRRRQLAGSYVVTGSLCFH